MKIELDDPANPENVISIEVARARNLMFKESSCQHLAVKIDRLEAMLSCSDCGKEINPIEWIAFLAEHWGRIQELMRRYHEAKVSFEAKQRCRCEHCGQLTKVRPATAAQVRAFKRGVQQDEGNPA